MLQVVFLLSLLTACKTVYVVPVIQEPIINDAPDHEKWDFKYNGENYTISEQDLKELTKYIVNLKLYADNGWTWTKYYIDEMQRITEQFK